mgnify:CR=1 FL=1
MKRTREEAEQTKLHILKAAVELFAKKGYAAATLSEIAEKAAVTRGAIYHHFENKQTLFIELLKNGSNPLFQLLRKQWRKIFLPWQ